MSRLGSTSGIDSTTTSIINEELRKYGLNKKISASATVVYLWKESRKAEWLIQKVDTTSDLIMSYATILNNPLITTYTDATVNYLTLTYGRFSEAF